MSLLSKLFTYSVAVCNALLHKCAEMAITTEIVNLILEKSTRANAEIDGQSQQEKNLFTLAIENRLISHLVKKTQSRKRKLQETRNMNNLTELCRKAEMSTLYSGNFSRKL